MINIIAIALVFIGIVLIMWVWSRNKKGIYGRAVPPEIIDFYNKTSQE